MNNQNIYGLGVGISTVFKIIYHSLDEVGAPLQGSSGMCQSIPLVMSNQNIYGLGLGISTVFKIIYHSLNERVGHHPRGLLVCINQFF